MVLQPLVLRIKRLTVKETDHKEMRITYIFHSGFAIETDNCILVFDYWMDPAGVMPQILNSTKDIYVFSSHFHEDHFTTEIFNWKNAHNNVTYILSKDILKHRRAQKQDANIWLAKGGHFEDENLEVYATGSNDSGVSWIVKTDGKTLFHAGDLNNWYARFMTDPNYHGGEIVAAETGELIDPLKDEKQFLGELKDIAKIAQNFDIVMFPVDARVGNGYTRGDRQFIERFGTGLFIPMHFVASGFESAWRMEEFTNERNIPFWKISKEGDTINVKSQQ